MIIDKIIMVGATIVLLLFLSVRFVKRYAPENLFIVMFMTTSLSLYITLAIKEINIPIYLQILILFFQIIIPSIAVSLQYHNIIITRKILYYRMKVAYFYKEYEKTIYYIEKITKIEGRKAEYLYILGQCYKHLDDFINARDSFALAIELNHMDYKSYYELGLVLDSTNKKELARVMYYNALRIKPDFYEAEEALGICYTSQGKFEKAVQVYRKALKNHPDSYELYYNIAMIENELGNYQESENAFRKAGEIKPDLYTAHYSAGNLSFNRGDYEQAVTSYKKVLSSSTYGPKAYFKLAITYATMKEYEKALGSLEYVMELNPIFIRKAQQESAFDQMRDAIDEYVKEKEKRLEKEKQKHNYMKEKWSLFKKKEVEYVSSKIAM